jgi:hypothetical protein
MSKNTEDFVKEIDIIKYKEYLLKNFKSIKNYCDQVIKGHSSNIPAQRSNKINILLNKNETYLSAISEAEGALKSAISEIESLLNENIDNYSIGDKVNFLEKMAEKMSKLSNYSKYLSETLDNLSLVG